MQTGTARSYVSRIEHGLVAPTVTTLERFAAALDIDIADLFITARLVADELATSSKSATRMEAPPTRKGDSVE
jgi:transcriptional regulator with XRE-family HTH domain